MNVEHILTFRRAPSLQPGNILVTSAAEYEIFRVVPEGNIVKVTVKVENGLPFKDLREFTLHDIDYVHIKIIL